MNLRWFIMENGERELQYSVGVFQVTTNPSDKPLETWVPVPTEVDPKFTTATHKLWVSTASTPPDLSIENMSRLYKQLDDDFKKKMCAEYPAEYVPEEKLYPTIKARGDRIQIKGQQIDYPWNSHVDAGVPPIVITDTDGTILCEIVRDGGEG